MENKKVRPIVKNYRNKETGGFNTVVISGDFSLPERKKGSDMEYTPYVKCRSISELIQIDSGSYADEYNGVFGTEDVENKTLKEIIADQIVDVAKTRLQEHIDNKENYLNKSKWDYILQAKREAGVNGNSAALEALYEAKAIRSKEFTENWYYEKLEELQEAVTKAIQYQHDCYSQLDYELIPELEEEVVVNLDDPDYMRWSQIEEQMERMSAKELVEFIEFGEIPKKYIGLALWLADHLEYEDLKRSWYVANFKCKCEEKRIERRFGKAWIDMYYRAKQEEFKASKHADCAFSYTGFPVELKELKSRYEIRHGIAAQLTKLKDKFRAKEFAANSKRMAEKLNYKPELKLMAVAGETYLIDVGIEITDIKWIPTDPNWEQGESGEWYYNVVNVA